MYLEHSDVYVLVTSLIAVTKYPRRSNSKVKGSVMLGKARKQEGDAAGHTDPESASREGDMYVPLEQKELHVGIFPKQCLQNMSTSVSTEKKES